MRFLGITIILTIIFSFALFQIFFILFLVFLLDILHLLMYHFQTICDLFHPCCFCGVFRGYNFWLGILLCNCWSRSWDWSFRRCNFLLLILGLDVNGNGLATCHHFNVHVLWSLFWWDGFDSWLSTGLHYLVLRYLRTRFDSIQFSGFWLLLILLFLRSIRLSYDYLYTFWGSGRLRRNWRRDRCRWNYHFLIFFLFLFLFFFLFSFVFFFNFIFFLLLFFIFSFILLLDYFLFR